MRSPGLTLAQINVFAERIRDALLTLFAVLALLLILVLFSPLAHAETNLTSSVTSANGELTTVLTWESTHTQCIASGHPSFEGPVPSSGTLALPTITMSGTYPISLSCKTPEDRTATLSWFPPTENTDGTPLTNLAGYSIHYGQSDSELIDVVMLDLDDPQSDPSEAGRVQYSLVDLPPGEHFFAIKARNALGAESALSNVVSKVLTDEESEVETVTLTVNPIPNTVSGFAVE